ncbi:MAG: 2-oxoacid:acceptor oxidoreductase family protein [Acidobacteria bacterium]|nr:2-oxoacid:acceptor oxidoreductase family protein [Acidobacteriota bacterium]
MRQLLSGNAAAAWGFRLSRVQCYPYYPITPSTTCSEQVAAWVGNGEMGTVVINVESEHTAATAVISAAKDVRAGTATSSKGLLYMVEVLENGAGGSLPFTIFVGNRATGAPINIWGDNSDAYAVRDSGLIQIFAADAQEALDSVIQAYRIGEDLSVRQPALVNLRGFTGTHTFEGVELPSAEDVDAFLPPYVPLEPLFSADRPVTYGAMLAAYYYRRHKRNQTASLRNALAVTEKVGKEFGERFGRTYGIYEWIGDSNAEVVIALLGETSGIAEAALDHLRGRTGVSSLAVLKVRLFNPFPARDIATALYKAGTKAVVVLDEGLPHGDVLPPLAQRIASSLQVHLGSQMPRVASVIGGLGGSEIRPDHFQTLFNLGANIAEGHPYRREPYWLDIEEDPILLTDEKKVDAKLWKQYGEIWKAQPIREPYQVPFPSTHYEIRLYGRAGQGAITSAVFFTGAGVESGLRMVTKPTFGSERRGAVVHTDTLLQTSGGRKTRSFGGKQDLVCIYDDTILTSPIHAPTRDLKSGGVLLVNTSRYSPERIRELLNLTDPSVSVYVVPASRIAQQLHLGGFFNMVMLGAMHRVCPHLELDTAMSYYQQNAPRPQETNLEAIRRGYQEATEHPTEETVPVVVDERAEAYFRWRPEDETLEEEMLRSMEVTRGS